MTYQITAKAPKGKKVTKTVEGVRQLNTSLSEYRKQGLAITRIVRAKQPRKMVSLFRRLQLS